MANLPFRDPVSDHLLTPQNAALVVIDYQPPQFAAVRSIDRDLLLENIVSTVKTAKALDLPFSVLSESELGTLSDLCRRLGKGRD